MIAYSVALVALLIFVLNQSIEQRIFVIVIVAFLLFSIGLFLKKYNVAPIDLDESPKLSII